MSRNQARLNVPSTHRPQIEATWQTSPGFNVKSKPISLTVFAPAASRQGWSQLAPVPAALAWEHRAADTSASQPVRRFRLTSLSFLAKKLDANTHLQLDGLEVVQLRLHKTDIPVWEVHCQLRPKIQEQQQQQQQPAPAPAPTPTILTPSHHPTYTNGTATLIGSEGPVCFVVGRELGSGRFASVYEVTPVGSMQQFAMKAPKRIHEMSGVVEPIGAAVFAQKNQMTEEQVLLQLAAAEEECRYIIKCHGTADIDGRHCLVLEHVPRTLRGILQNTRPDDGATRLLARQAASALSYLHARHIVHRDIKLDNVLWSAADQCIKLHDFGGAYVGAVELEEPIVMETLVGTRGCWAPEVVEGVPYTEAADIWSLGCLILEIAIREMPFKAIVLSGKHVKVADTQDMLAEGGAYANSTTPALRAFLRTLFVQASDRPPAAQLLQHPFLSVAD